MLKRLDLRGRLNARCERPGVAKLQVAAFTSYIREVKPFSAQLGVAPRVATTNHRPVDRKAEVLCKSQSSSAVQQPSENDSGGPGVLIAVVLGLAALAGGVYYTMATPSGIMFKDMLVNGPLGRSGFLAAFSLIFLSEIGDKTFFIAALLAMKLGRWVSFFGSLGALGVMTVISVSIGAFFSKVPDALKSSIPIGEIAGIVLLVVFGLKALKEGFESSAGHKAEEEMEDAESAVKEAETAGRVQRNNTWASLIEVATLIFIAEWGDRSMLATIALGAAQNPVGVAVGAVVGHAVATGIAVLGGAIAAKYISEKTINITSGVLFLVFAAATGYSML